MNRMIFCLACLMVLPGCQIEFDTLDDHEFTAYFEIRLDDGADDTTVTATTMFQTAVPDCTNCYQDLVLGPDDALTCDDIKLELNSLWILADYAAEIPGRQPGEAYVFELLHAGQVHQREIVMPEPLIVAAPVPDEVVRSGDLIEWETGPDDVFCEVWFGPAGLTGNLEDLALLKDSCISVLSVPDNDCTGTAEVPELGFIGEAAGCQGEIVIIRKRWGDDLPTEFGSSMTFVEQRMRVPVIFKRQDG